MNKPLVFFVAALLAGAGWYALHRAGENRVHRFDRLAETGPVVSETADRAGPHAARTAPGSRTSLGAPHGAELPLAFDYAAGQPQPDGSFAVRWDFEATRTLRPGDVMRVHLPFAATPYTASVQEESTVGGTRRLTGRLREDDGIDSWPFSVTLSADRQYVAANFETAAAHFSVEADPRGGRLKDTQGDGTLENDAVR
ncbi:hypothetical protein [Lysobacter arvi]|uniref:Uncharacterized protein n=1 Tax=Lysobacter arvi TaxID=3038776 RepID=A0ABU1C928_9GAMM|nr:hypothetical protein [Lysobacter arvi]MDR0181693.1 hypothetical protein [Lysobacter arvi]